MKYNSKYKTFISLIFCGIGLTAQAFAQQPAVIKIEETIRGNQEQPKVLTIVPWQSPTTKQALPSPIVERINKKFVPLQREELTLQIQILNHNNGVSKQQ